jgi:hypothetical protein
LKEVFKSGGSNCEHCFIGDDSECIQDLNYFTMSNEMCDEACPDGTVLNTDLRYKHYCQKCTLDEYFDTDKKKCIPFSGCPKGTYFDPSSNIKVKSYNRTNEYSALWEALGEDTITMDNIFFLDDLNTDSNCKPCTLNTYMDQDFHTNRSCSNCELIQRKLGEDILKTVNKNRTSCETCIINNGNPNQSTNSKNARYVTTINGTYSCERCPNLDNDDDDKDKSSIFSITPIVLSGEKPEGTCYKECNGGVTINNQIIKANQKELNSDGSYSNCEFTCSANYFIPENSNSCFPCPVGKERAVSSSESSCTPCIDGYYNDVPGGTCQPCPSLDYNELYNLFKPHSPEGSSNIKQCYYKCLGNDGNEVETASAMLYGTKQNYLYDFNNCPTEACFAGYERQNLEDNTGYKNIARQGTRNLSKVRNNCKLSNPSVRLSLEGLCDSGFKQTKIVSTERLHLLYRRFRL